MNEPTPEQVREALADLDTRDQKIVTGMFGAMAQNAGQVRDREWMSQQLVEMSVLAGDFEGDSTEEVIARVGEFLQDNATRLLEASFLLFQRTALDLEPRAKEGFALEDALRIAIGYLPSGDDAS